MTRFSLISLLLLAISLSTSAQDDPLAISRPDTVYDTVLTGKRIDRKVMSWYNGWAARPTGCTDGEWALERNHILEESRDAGMDGPFLPAYAAALGESGMDRLNRDTGMKFPFMIHGKNYSAPAKKAGAKFLFGMNYVSGEKGRVAPWDPRYREESSRSTEAWLKENGKMPWLSCVLGFDEPLNYAGTSRTPGAVETVNRAIREKYGIKLALSPVDTAKAYFEWPTDPAALNADPRDVALLRIAVWRWLNKNLHAAAKREFELVRTYAPGVEYHAYNRNAINIFDFINTNVRNSLDRLDQSLEYDVTDCFSADPYPTGNLERDGSERAKYHVGFISKFITDLAGGKPSKIIMQAFRFSGRWPTVENMREWTSQAAKAGVTHLEWYGWPRTLNPELYREMLRLSRLWKDMPLLDIPEKTEVAVLFSDDSRNAVNDAGMNAFYTLHVLLGENIGVWYRFVGENQVRRGQQTLDGARLIIAPQLGYVSRDFARTLIAHVESGATLVVMDPDALDWDIETGSLAEYRKKLLGAPMGKKWEASQLTPTIEGKKRFPGFDYLLLQPGPGGVTARRLEIPRDAQVLFSFGDGVPAAYRRTVGRGEVILFGAQPFGNALTAVRPFGWDRALTSLCDRLSVERQVPLWRFMFPASGGEVPTFEPLQGK